MTLTRLLDDRQSALRIWFETRLPNVRPMQAAYRAAGPPTLLAGPGVSLGTVGTAFDYRLRYYFAVTPPQRFAAAQGAYAQPASWLGAGPDGYARLCAGLTAAIAAMAPVGRRLDPEDESLLCRYCYVLALYEECYRAPAYTRESPLGTLPQNCSPDDLLSVVPDDAVADLDTLSRAFFESQTELLRRGRGALVLNPVLSGAGLVGGADADLVIDHCLIEIKATKKPGLSRETAYQLIGYALLDLEDDLAIQSVAFYLPRIPALVAWPLADLLVEVGGPRASIDLLRAELQTLLLSSRETGIRRPRVGPRGSQGSAGL